MVVVGVFTPSAPICSCEEVCTDNKGETISSIRSLLGLLILSGTLLFRPGSGSSNFPLKGIELGVRSLCFRIVLTDYSFLLLQFFKFSVGRYNMVTTINKTTTLLLTSYFNVYVYCVFTSVSKNLKIRFKVKILGCINKTFPEVSVLKVLERPS